MADYYPLIARAVDGIPEGTPESRRAVYERARTALMQQLRSLDPPLSEEDIERERLSLDEAIGRVESDHQPRPAETERPPAPLSDFDRRPESPPRQEVPPKRQDLQPREDLPSRQDLQPR